VTPKTGKVLDSLNNVEAIKRGIMAYYKLIFM